MELTTQHLYALGAAIICALALVSLIAYRIGLGTVRGINTTALAEAEDSNRALRKAIASLNTACAIDRDDAHQANTQLSALMKKQEHHQAQLQAISEDADNRVAQFANRQLTHEDLIHLRQMAAKLELAAEMFARFTSHDQATQARQLAARALNIAARYRPAPSTWECVDEAQLPGATAPMCM